MWGSQSYNFSSQGLEGCDLVDDLIDSSLVIRFGFLTQYSDEASLEVLESLFYAPTPLFLLWQIRDYLKPMQMLRVVGVPEDKLAHRGVDTTARFLGIQIWNYPKLYNE